MTFRRHVLLLASLILLAYGIACTVLGPCVTSIEETFLIDHDTMGVMFAAGSIGYLIGVRLGGWLAGPLGLSLTLRVGVAGLGAGLLLIGASPFFSLCVAGHCLSGMSGGILEPALVSSVQVLYPEKRRRALNISQVGFGLGAIVGPFTIKTVLGAEGTWRLGFLFAGVATASLLLIFPRRPIPDGGAEGDDGEATKAAASDAPIRSPLATPTLWLMSLALMFYVGGELALTAWSSPYFEKTRGMSKAQASLAPLWLWVGLLLGRIAMGFVSDRTPSRLILFVCSIVGVVFSGAALLCEQVWLSYMLLAISGIGLGPIWPTVLVHSASRLGTDSASALSWVIIGGGFGALAQALLGYIAEATSLSVALGVAVTLLLGVIVCLIADWAIERLRWFA